MVRSASIILFLFLSAGLFAQTAVVRDSSGQLIFTTINDRLQDSSGQVLYTMRGNLIFKGDSYRNEDMLYLIKNSDVMGSNAGYIYNFDMSATLYSFKKGRFYIGEDRLPERMVMVFENGDSVEVLDGDEIKIGTFSGDKPTDLLLAFLGLAGHYQVKEKFSNRADSTVNGLGSGIIGTIQPAWSQHYYYQW